MYLASRVDLRSVPFWLVRQINFVSFVRQLGLLQRKLGLNSTFSGGSEDRKGAYSHDVPMGRSVMGSIFIRMRTHYSNNYVDSDLGSV